MPQLSGCILCVLCFRRGLLKATAPSVSSALQVLPACSKSLHSCLTLCDLMDCSWPGSFVHGISQARILESAAISFPRSSWPRDRTLISCTPSLAGGFFTTSTTWEPAQEWWWASSPSKRGSLRSPATEQSMGNLSVVSPEPLTQ